MINGRTCLGAAAQEPSYPAARAGSAATMKPVAPTSSTMQIGGLDALNAAALEAVSGGVKDQGVPSADAPGITLKTGSPR